MKIKVIEQSHERLKLKIIPNGFILAAGGMLFIAMGCLTIYCLGYQTSLTVQKSRLEFQQRFLGWFDFQSFSLSAEEVSEIKLELVEGFARSYEVTIYTQPETSQSTLLQPKFVLADGDTKQIIADQTLIALATPEGVYEYTEDGTWPAIILGGACLVGGLICWWFIQSTLIVADRTRDSIQVFRRRFFLPIADQQTIPVSAVTEVESIASAFDTAKHHVTSYHVAIHGSANQPVFVAHGPMFTESDANRLIELLVNWINE